MSDVFALPNQIKNAEAIFQDTRNTRLDVVLCIDESSSVRDAWDMVLTCARNCTLCFDFDDDPNPKVRMGLIKYHSSATLVTPLNSSRQLLCQIISGLKLAGGGTELVAALQMAEQVLNTNPRACSRMIIVFTDEDVSDEAVAYAQGLLAKNISILCFSIGRHNIAKVSRLTSPKGAFLLKDWTETLSLFNGVNLKPFEPPTLTVFNRSPDWVGVQVNAENYQEVDIDVYDPQTKQKVFGYQFSCEGSSHYILKGLPNNKPFEACARIKYSNGSTTAFGPKQPFRTMAKFPDSELLKDKTALKSNVSETRERINNLLVNCSMVLNILLLGVIGKGKSSFTNTVATALAPEGEELRLAHFNDMLTSVTKELSKYSINAKNNVLLWDIFGLDGTNYDSIFNFLLGGNLKDGYTEGSDVNETVYDPNPSIDDMPHCVCIVFSANSLCTPDELQNVKAFFDKVTAKGFQPLIILTKLDSEESTGLNKDNLDTIWDNPVVDAMIETFVQGTKIDRSNVFPVVNYRGQNQRNDIQDKLALNAIDCAIKEAINRVRYLQRKRTLSFSRMPLPSNNNNNTVNDSAITAPPGSPQQSTTSPMKESTISSPSTPSTPSKRSFFVKKAGTTQKLRVFVKENQLETLRAAIALKYRVKIAQVGDVFYLVNNEPVTMVDDDDVEGMANDADLIANISD
mmetsp:Transcript_16677/g.23170  ORF Transcript_16677/g.23170 Transcript_16677/m.23170 type:complete len:685 (+) Transcript_16677:45-2099(+)